MEHKNNNNSGSGFLLGILIGVAITLLFTTKKGRKILKTFTDEGLDKLTNLEDLFEKKMRDEDEDDLGLSDYDAKSAMTQAPAPVPNKAQEQVQPYAEPHHHQETIHIEHYHEHPREENVQQSPVHTEHVAPQPIEYMPDEVSLPQPEFRREEIVSVPSPFHHPTTGGRRFFRGIPKRSN